MSLKKTTVSVDTFLNDTLMAKFTLLLFFTKNINDFLY